jgi:replicative superfamily II helicase
MVGMAGGVRVMAELSWLTGHLDDLLVETATNESRHRLFASAMRLSRAAEFDEDIEFTSESLQLLVHDSLSAVRTEGSTRDLCAQIFALERARVSGELDLDARRGLLRAAAFGVLADQGPIAAKLLDATQLPVELPESADWSSRVENTVVDAWLLLLRKRDWSDIDRIAESVQSLRNDQRIFEQSYLSSQDISPHPAAWKLVALYHLARAVELVATFLTLGEVDHRFDVRQQVEAHFDRTISAADNAVDVELADLSRLLAATAGQILDNSLWSLARAAGPAVQRFVSSLVSRSRSKPLLEVLPPQRHALGDSGLARSAKRAVVVSLPTSAGKTLIAEFRILQALSLFQEVGGWAAYVVPTRALVNQVTMRLRRDFGPLGIQVEKVSPALDVDSVESDILKEDRPDARFRVLVATPEKLDLLIRGGWHEEVNRPLCLLVVDEAHNIGESARGLRLELLLATVNRELRDVQFLLLTPFIRNSQELSEWLDPVSNDSVTQSVDWLPNDRIIAIAEKESGDKRGDYHIALETVSTSRQTISVPGRYAITGNRPLGLSYSAAGVNKVAAATSVALEPRGATITLTQSPARAWSVAADIRASEMRPPRRAETSEDLRALQQVLAVEFGADFPLIGMLSEGIGVHHSGLPDEVKVCTEWLVEAGQIDHLVATTTIAQGVNFPVANIVFATHQYPYGATMPPSDFWNVAGRAGRVDQGETGLIALASIDPERSNVLREFVGEQVQALNSTLVEMVKEALDGGAADLDLSALSYRPEWSAFLQFLAHTYRQIGNHEEFAAEVEQVLRGTLGFQTLRATNSSWAAKLIGSVRSYAEQLQGQPLSLVDSTGFSWDSVRATLGRLASSSVNSDTWQQPLFSSERAPLRDMIGLMLRVPELRASLLEGAQGARDPGSFLADVMHDWVNGASIRDIATSFFPDKSGDSVASLTRCCKRLFGDIAPTVAWGMSALQSLTVRDMESFDEAERRLLRNLPAQAFYGVRSDGAIAMRLLGVPRAAAESVARTAAVDTTDLYAIRGGLRDMSADDWAQALEYGSAYYRVWKIVDGDPA